MCTERKATGLFVLADFLCDNGTVTIDFYTRGSVPLSIQTGHGWGTCTVVGENESS